MSKTPIAEKPTSSLEIALTSRKRIKEFSP
jgi:hypothetical protein